MKFVVVLFALTSAFSIWAIRLFIQPGSLIAPIALFHDWPEEIWLLKWTGRGLYAGHFPVVTHLLNAPGAANMLWSTANYFWSGLVFPVTRLNMIAGYDLAIALSVISAGFVVYLLARRWGCGKYSATAAGILFELSPYMTGQAINNHIVLLGMFGGLMILLAIDELAFKHGGWGSWRILSVAVLGFDIQLYTSEEVLLILVLMVLLIGFFAVVRFRDDLFRCINVFSRTQWVVGAFAIGIPALFMYHAQYFSYGALHGPFVPPLQYVSNLASVIVPGPNFFLTNSWTISRFQSLNPSPSETTLYWGVPAVVFAFWRYRNGDTKDRFLILVAFVATCLCLSSPWYLLQHLPLVQFMVPSRISLIADLALCLLWARWFSAFKPNISYARKWIAAGLIILPWLPALAPVVKPQIPVYFTTYKAKTQPTLLILPYALNGITATPMLWQAAADYQFKMPEGYYTARSYLSKKGFNVGPVLTTATRTLFALSLGVRLKHKATRNEICVYLKQHEVTEVILGPAVHFHLLYNYIKYVFHSSGRSTQGVITWPANSCRS